MKISGYLKSFLLWVRSRPTETPYVFVIGAPRSGTSLLKNLLVTHSRLCGTDRESTGLIRLRNFYDFQIGELDSSEISALFSSAQGLPSLYDKLVVSLLKNSKDDLFVDKVNIAGWRLRYLRKYFPNAMYINIVRDGRDSYCSALHHPNVNQSATVENYAKYWKKCVELPNKLLPPSRLFSIRYEDLVAEPAEELKKIMEFIGYPFEDKQVDVMEYSKVSSLKRRDVHKNLAAPVSNKSVDRWRRELSDQDKKVFWKIAGTTLDRAGYQS